MLHFLPLQSDQIDETTKMMEDFYAIDGYPIQTSKTKELFQEFIANENLGKCWLIYSNNEIAGYVILTFIFSFEFQGRIAFLDELYIQPQFQGKGIGKKTVEFIQNQIANFSLKLLFLEVEKHNSKAQKLYIACGFDFHNRKLMKYLPNKH
jgi:ribosomal protein S18 acetylase RimI-like enzyme